MRLRIPLGGLKPVQPQNLLRFLDAVSHEKSINLLVNWFSESILAQIDNGEWEFYLFFTFWDVSLSDNQQPGYNPVNGLFPNPHISEMVKPVTIPLIVLR